MFLTHKTNTQNIFILRGYAEFEIYISPKKYDSIIPLVAQIVHEQVNFDFDNIRILNRLKY